MLLYIQNVRSLLVQKLINFLVKLSGLVEFEYKTT